MQVIVVESAPHTGALLCRSHSWLWPGMGYKVKARPKALETREKVETWSGHALCVCICVWVWDPEQVVSHGQIQTRENCCEDTVLLCLTGIKAVCTLLWRCYLPPSGTFWCFSNPRLWQNGSLQMVANRENPLLPRKNLISPKRQGLQLGRGQERRAPSICENQPWASEESSVSKCPKQV